MSQIKRVLLVGHCGPDTWMLKSWVKRVLKGVTVSAVKDQVSVTEAGADALLLVNRVLDGRFEGMDGVELIRRVSNGQGSPVALLISNYTDAQQRAVEAGGRPGFGKSEIGSKEAAQRLKNAVG